MGRRKREREELAKKTLPEGLTPPPSILGSVLADSQLPVDLDESIPSLPTQVVDMVEEREKEEDQLFTFIYRGPRPNVTREGKVSYIIVNHVDKDDSHYHFVFKSLPGNKMRCFQNVTTSAGIANEFLIPCQSTLQPVRNWPAFAAYLNNKDNTRKQLVGRSMFNEYHELNMAKKTDQAKAIIKREERRQKPKTTNYEEKRHNRMNNIIDLIKKYDAISLPDLKRKMKKIEVLSLYDAYGKVWEETATVCVDAFVEEKIANEKANTFSFTMHQVCLHGHRGCENYDSMSTFHEAFLWLHHLLTVNGISPQGFLNDVDAIMDCIHQRKNAFVIEGPTTTGKTLILKLIAAQYHYGTVQRSGDTSQFAFQNLIDKSVALMEEPRISPITVNDFKELLGGSPFDIHVKHSRDHRLDRLPVLISTNNPITMYLNHEDAQAIEERIVKYNFKVHIPSDTLPLPPCYLCVCHFAFFYETITNGLF